MCSRVKGEESDICSSGGVCFPRGCLLLGGVCFPRGCLLWGVSAPRGCLLWGCLLQGVSALGGVCSQGGLLWGVSVSQGGVCSWGVSAPRGVSAPGGSAPRGSAPRGVWVSQHALRQTPPLLTESQMPVKTLAWPNFVAAGKNTCQLTTKSWSHFRRNTRVCLSKGCIFFQNHK